MKINTKKPIEILLRPEDFIGNDYSDIDDCALTRAAKRHFKTDKLTCDPYELHILDTYRMIKKVFLIKDNFGVDDFNFVRNEYKKDPKMKKVKYYVTLTKEPCES